MALQEYKYSQNPCEFRFEMDLYTYLKKLYKTKLKNAYFFICENENKNWVQKTYKSTEIDKAFADIVHSNAIDVYGSTCLHSSAKRVTENVIQIPALLVDLDYYKTPYRDLTPKELVKKLEEVYFKPQKIPYPNAIISSGNGVYLIWFLKFTPGTDGTLLKRRVIVKILYEMLKEFGADAKALDAAHVFRLPNTYNSKVTDRHKREVKAFVNELDDYTLSKLSKKLPSLWEVWKKKHGIRTEQEKRRKGKIISVPQFKTRTLAYDHIKSILQLIELRKGECTGYREMMLFFLRDRYHTMHAKRFYQQDETLFAESYAFIKEVNQKFTKPLSDKEIRTNTLNKTKLYKFKTKTIIEWFDITLEEQIQLKVKTREAKNEKSKRQMRELRRKRGALTRREYLKQQHSITDDKLFKLKELLERYPNAKRKELAEMLGVSVYRVDQLKRELKSL
uniref:Replication protein n=1 Tax=Geobacillus sp. (strain WCH70) TaxID=471223 RepID=C5DB40_GEOSW